MVRLRDLLRGCVRAEVRGDRPERLLNESALRGAGLREVRRTPEGMTLYVSVPAYFILCAAARGTGCRVRALGKRGLPFRARRWTRRRALLLCAALCCGLLWWLSGFVWTIGLSGCRTVSQCQVLELLSEAGLRTGARRRTVDGAALRDLILPQEPRLAFFTVHLTGCHAEVRVWERAKSPPPESVEPCDVVSDKAGVILRLRVTAGRALVKEGETVLPGDRLASGSLESGVGERWRVPARAVADLRTWRTVTRTLTAQVQARSYTGNVQKRRYLVLGDRRFPLEIVEKEPFAWYDKQIERRDLSPRPDFRVPIALVTETAREYVPAEGAPVRDLLARRVRELMERDLAAAVAEVVTADFALTGEGPFTAALEAECIEQAGVSAPLAEEESQP